ncbi:MAG: hypothetical protein ACLP1Q_10410 [Solirubrobacteraceae bacterium]
MEGPPSAQSPISALPTPRSGGSGRPRGLSDVERTIEILCARIAEEFQISERYDSKGRQLFALAAGFFAAVQAVAFAAFGTEHLAQGSRLLLLVVALGASAVLVIVGHRLANAEEPLGEKDIKPDELVEWLESGEGEEAVLLKQAGALATVAELRAESNKTRKLSYDALQTVARCSLIVSGIELVAAIAVRL